MLPFAVNTEDLPIGLVVAVIVAMVLAFIFDRIARAVGLRRDKRWDWTAALLLAAAGAYFGWKDGGRQGAIIGGIAAFIGGTLAAAAAFGALAVVWSVLAGPKWDPEYYPRKKDRRKPSFLGGRIAVLLGGILPAAFAALIAHEVYWMSNLAALTAQYGVGYTIADYSAHERPREDLVAALQQNRWQLEAGQWRPQRWLLFPEYADENKAALEYVDFVSGNKPPKEKPAAWNTDWEQALWTEWTSAGFDAARLDPVELNRLGVHIANDRYALFNACLDRTLVLRYLPREMFVKEQKTAKQPAAAGGKKPGA